MGDHLEERKDYTQEDTDLKIIFIFTYVYCLCEFPFTVCVRFLVEPRAQSGCLELELQAVVNNVGAKKSIRILCKNSKCS